jgi:hypothetical protein
MIDLVVAAKSVNTVVNVVEGGTLESTLADLGLAAAKDALSKVTYAEDKRAQVWSAVNHLEQAESALRTTIQTRGNRLMYVNRPGLEEDLIQKRRYMLGLMAVCYRYLGERALTERTLSTIPGADEGFGARMEEKHWTIFTTNIVSPAFWRDVYRSDGGEVYRRYTYDIPTFSRSLMATWGSGHRDRLRFSGFPD